MTTTARATGDAYPSAMPTAAEDPRRLPGRTTALTGLISDAGGMRRTYVDATGASVALPAAVRRVVATDDEVGALLVRLGAQLIGCAGALDGVERVGPPRAPDPKAVAALRPDVIVVGAVDRTHDLADTRLLAVLWRVAPVIAVEVGRPAAAVPDMRALIGRLDRPTPGSTNGRRAGPTVPAP